MEFISFVYYYLLPFIGLFSYYVYRKYSYWSDKGVKGPRAVFPFGYLLSRFTSDPLEFELNYKEKYGNLYGVYTGMTPSLTISDVDLVKQVMIKDFHLFVNRRKFNILDKIWKTNLFVAHDEDWKRIRSITTPAFTSGKLRRMIPLLKQATDKLENYFTNICKDGQATVDIKKIISGFTIDVIASTSFGTDTDSNGDRTKFNPFLYHGRRLLMDVSVFSLLAILSMPTFFLKMFNIQHTFPKDSFKFFIDVSQTMIQRGGSRDDLVKLLKEANVSEDDLKNLNYNDLTATSDVESVEKSESNSNVHSKNRKYLTDDEIIAQCIIFFIAGYETTASTLAHVCFEFTHHPEVQEKLFHEVNDKLKDLDPNDLNKYYETIMNDIPYLDAVLKETLRKYPILPRLERRLDADEYELGGIKLGRDSLVEISAVAVHYDEKNYENPFKYDPERFMPENKHKLNPYAYLPFGIGPRNCVGMRFAYQEAKICLAMLSQKFVFSKSSKTPEKLIFPTGTGNLFAASFDIAVNLRK